MSTQLTAAVLALVGVAAVVGIAWVFYLVGRAEDRDRAAADAARQPPPPPEPVEDHSHENGKIARDRRRPMPRRRGPQR
jgi:hypothetical protein